MISNRFLDKVQRVQKKAQLGAVWQLSREINPTWVKRMATA